MTIPGWEKIAAIAGTIGAILCLALLLPMSPPTDVRIYTPGVIVDAMEGVQAGRTYRLESRGKTYNLVLADRHDSDMYDGDLDAKMVEAANTGRPVAVFGCAGTRNSEKYLYVTKINIGEKR